MPLVRRRFTLTVILASFVFLGTLGVTTWPLVAAEELPKQLSDEAFWHLVTDFSEPGGFFRSDNFVSNEATFQWVIPDLKNNSRSGGVYLGGGPDLTYNGPGNGNNFGGRGRMPSYAELMTQNDGHDLNRSYVSTEENFRILQDLENKNLLIPLVGDFAGPKAIRAVAEYLREHDASVTAFYTSNVEQYLFQQNDDWNKFYTNVATLPVDS